MNYFNIFKPIDIVANTLEFRNIIKLSSIVRSGHTLLHLIFLSFCLSLPVWCVINQERRILVRIIIPQENVYELIDDYRVKEPLNISVRYYIPAKRIATHYLWRPKQW